ncbi:Hypothetical predicted protein [Pelobates cultripes]|uniref:Reverse transcriptase domain-containing protein n=1 Tax=Pelobates cultripes TaxID=61616 RepID=A0AAD1S164_PELCU|nr:Hypothetical predicted protein [Pelobates cultripes]
MKTTYYRQGNRAGKLLASHLKERTSQVKIPYVRDGHGTKVMNPKAIVDEFAAFYAQLYNLSGDTTQHQPTPQNITTFLEGIHLPQLSTEQATALTNPIVPTKISRALCDTPRHKTPGPDGYSTHYYIVFEDLLLPHLTAIFNHILDTGNIPPEMLEATIVTLPKPGKSTDSCANYCPISLLNADTQLFTKVLVNRIRPLLYQLVSPEKSGFVPGCQVEDNTRRSLDIMELMNSDSSQGLMIALGLYVRGPPQAYLPTQILNWTPIPILFPSSYSHEFRIHL